ncbi:MAG: twitch domain-containing radical SAM protein [Bdellovibrionia bacterium]
MNEQPLTPEKTMCRYRWSYPLVHLTTGEIKTCCHVLGNVATQEEVDRLGPDLFLNHPRQIEYRREMANGIRNDSCSYCWNMEDKGINSPRQAGQHINYHFNRIGIEGPFNDIVAKIRETPELLKSSNPDLVEISLGRSCDLKCMYCSENFSSLWEQERRKFGDPLRNAHVETPPERFQEHFWTWFEQVHKSLTYISFIGGEPLISPEFHKTVDRIYDLYDRDPSQSVPTLGVISNFMAPPKVFKKFLDTAERAMTKFPVLMLASVDTVGPRAEYIRNGLIWDRFVSNVRGLLALRPQKLMFTINPTINVLSVSSMLELLKLAKSLQDEFDFPVALGRNLVMFPKWYNPMLLTPDFAPYLSECVDFLERNKDPKYVVGHHGNWDMYIDFLKGLRDAIRDGSPDPRFQASFLRQIQRNDRRRGTSVRAVFPEYADFFKTCESKLQREKPFEWEEISP